MPGVLYFAYGSNLLRQRLEKRCPGIVPGGVATLPKHRLTFDKVSIDKSGKCAFALTEDQDLPGVLWRIPRAELGGLDAAEGAGRGYERSTIRVLGEDDALHDVLIYRATNLQDGMAPYDWYLALVIAGAMQQGLPATHVQALRQQPFRVDAELDRAKRREAIATLEDADMREVFDGLGC